MSSGSEDVLLSFTLSSKFDTFWLQKARRWQLEAWRWSPAKQRILEYPKNNITDRKNTFCIWSNYPGDSEFVCSELSTSCRRVINPIWACSSFDLQNVAGKFQSLPFFSNQTLTCSWASHTISVVTRAYISRWVNVCVCDVTSWLIDLKCLCSDLWAPDIMFQPGSPGERTNHWCNLEK